MKILSVAGGELTATINGELVLIEKSHPVLARETIVLHLPAFLELAKKVEAEAKGGKK